MSCNSEALAVTSHGLRESHCDISSDTSTNLTQRMDVVERCLAGMML